MVMGLDDVFEIVQSKPDSSENLEELSMVSVSVDGTKKQVLEAHRLLSSFNEKNKQEFMDLIRTFEESR